MLHHQALLVLSLYFTELEPINRTLKLQQVVKGFGVPLGAKAAAPIDSP